MEARKPGIFELFLHPKKAQEYGQAQNSSRGSEGADQKLCENVSALRRRLNLVKVQQQRVTDDPGEPFNRQHSW